MGNCSAAAPASQPRKGEENAARRLGSLDALTPALLQDLSRAG
jgi:hypothetical protein